MIVIDIEVSTKDTFPRKCPVVKSIDVIYGKQIQVSTKEKPRVVWFLNRLGVKWQECDSLEDWSKLPNPVS